MNTPTIHIVTRQFSVRLPLGDGPVKISSGLGGWQEISRPKNTAITEWVGVGAIQLMVPILLDGLADQRSVERDFRRVVRLGRRSKRPDEAPPTFRAHGPFPRSGERFVLAGVDWGDEVRRDDGRLIRQGSTLTLMEYQRGDVLRPRKKPRFRKLYRTKQGDTVRRVAVKLYGDAGRARKIARLNGIGNIRRRLKPGTLLRLSDDIGLLEASVEGEGE